MRLLSTLILLAAVQIAPALGQEPVPTGSISGTVTIDGKPAPGIVVIASVDQRNFEPKLVARTTTDRDGKFTLADLARGEYSLLPDAPAYVLVAQKRQWVPGVSVSLAEGETVEGVSLPLERGGVITGRVTDARGNPLIGETVSLGVLDENGRRKPTVSAFSDRATDDRGVYRLFGLRPGRYLVSVGEPSDGSQTTYGSARKKYPETFYPGVEDEASATPIEVIAGGEVTGIDIGLGRHSTTYAAAGRIVDEAGAPLARINVGYGRVNEGRMAGGFGFGSFTNDQGEFRFTGLRPGSYAAIAMPDARSTRSGAPAPFEVVDRDVSGIVITLKQGVTVSGTVVVEGPGAVAAASSTGEISVAISKLGETGSSIGSMFASKSSRVAADGTFTIRGVAPGQYRFGLFAYRGGASPMLARIERNGTVVANEIDVAADTDMSGIALVVVTGTGIIRGHITVTNGTLPFDRIAVRYGRAGTTMQYQRVTIDDRGQFLLSGLAAGEYTMSASGYTGERAGEWIVHRGKEQKVAVADGATADVTLTLDLQNDPTEKP